MAQESTEVSPEILELQGKVREAFLQLVVDEKQTDLWGRFRFAYNQRRQRPWLPESDGYSSILHASGLAIALTDALELRRLERLEWAAKSNSENNMFLPIDNKFKNYLLSCVDELTSYSNSGLPEPCGLDSFVLSLKWKRIDPNDLTIADIKEMFIKGLNVYWEQIHAHGWSGDPW